MRRVVAVVTAAGSSVTVSGLDRRSVTLAPNEAPFLLIVSGDRRPARSGRGVVAISLLNLPAP